MSISHLLAQTRPMIEQFNIDVLTSPSPKYVIFFSVSTGQERAHTELSCGNTLDDAWLVGAQALQRWCKKEANAPAWIRVDIVNHAEALRWDNLQSKLRKTKRNYFRFGLSFTPTFEFAILEQEIAANALLYMGTEGVATPNSKNLTNYSQQRFGCELRWPDDPEHKIWRFTTRSVFSDGKQTLPIENQGGHSGYRQLLNWQDELEPMIHSASDYLSRQVKKSGRFHYGWFPCFDRAIPTYNALRHASSTYALLEGWEVTQNNAQFAAIERALHDLASELIRTYTLPDGSDADFLVDTGDEIKLGGNAVCILAMAKYSKLTGNERYLAKMERLANGIAFMQNVESGAFVHVLHAADLSLKEEQRIIYYDGEAAFALMRLYGLTKNPRWLSIVERAMDNFIARKHWQAHDHWLSYCVNELTRYRPLARYYQFGLDNVRDHLDFVLKRVTTYPTLLELMMAAQRMIERLQADDTHRHLLADFDVDKFYRALEYRARYLANGFFWPELAMFFKNPQKIVGSFFIRHHSYRVRIDDVEHYLSGYVAYRKYRLQQASRPQQLVFLCGNFRHEGNGIEIASIRRCALFIRQLGVSPWVITSSWNPQLARTVEALYESGKLPAPVKALTVYDWLPAMLERGDILPMQELRPGTRAQTRKDCRNILAARRYVGAEGNLSHEDFVHLPTQKIVLRRHYRSLKGTAYLSGIELRFTDHEHRYASEEEFAAAMLAHNLDRQTMWHFLVDKNLPWRKFVSSNPKNWLNATLTSVIHSTHQREDGEFKQAYRHVLRDATLLDRIIVLTDAQKHDLAKVISNAKRLCVIPHHLTPALPVVNPQKNAGKRVLFMARYAPEKQHQLLFSVFAQVVKTMPDAELHTYGSGGLKKELEQWVIANHLDKHIYLHDRTDELELLHRQSSCAVLCSSHEGFSLFGLESLAHGTPLVSVDIQYGPRDLLENSGAGILVKPNDETALAEALIEVLQNPQQRAQMQENALRHATRYSEQQVATLWQTWWQEMQALASRDNKGVENRA
ncbi:TPA: glycosyltransferase [Citrobacter farmeri]|uniref:glycosyltransferase n=1 Tax=Citrobacter freundii TaxID=546 RepID=UPI002549CCE0|nr:glycosyltransferase [Citrobacter freundii]MDK6382814.1 glycosyltransferase [Citrobacter freundii]HEM8563220.1 glycosyltransferase [Citrobacter farmeri]